MSDRLNVAVLGATGYAGIELVRLIELHPALDLVYASSEQYVGRTLASVYPALARRGGLTLEALDVDQACERADVVFTSLPHGKAAATVAAIVKRGRAIVDLSADFRLHDRALFERTYQVAHPAPELLAKAVYGLTELHRKEIAGARLVANPGCYPTGALLGIAPLATAGVEIDSIVVDAKSGASGAGRSAQTDLLFCEVNENLRAYQVGTHRHAPEIDQELALLAPRMPATLFVPHLVPLTRGILSTIYVRCAGLPATRLAELFRASYAGEPFVDLREDGGLPEVRDVRGSNRCAIGWRVDQRSGMAIVVTAIDNLVKGAAGQAVQNLNVMQGWREDLGLEATGLVP
jgi:N-acetyl-gamma-glutamyl-phosphate reductase